MSERCERVKLQQQYEVRKSSINISYTHLDTFQAASSHGIKGGAGEPQYKTNVEVLTFNCYIMIKRGKD